MQEEEIKSNNQCCEGCNETYEEKSYLKDMSMYNARVNISLRTHMFKCKMNYSSDPMNNSSVPMNDLSDPMYDSSDPLY